jgi:hypothetical protein
VLPSLLSRAPSFLRVVALPSSPLTVTPRPNPNNRVVINLPFSGKELSLEFDSARVLFIVSEEPKRVKITFLPSEFRSSEVAITVYSHLI